MKTTKKILSGLWKVATSETTLEVVTLIAAGIKFVHLARTIKKTVDVANKHLHDSFE